MIAVFAAPALMLYAHSDAGQWSSPVEHWLFSPPIALSTSAFAYVVIVGFARRAASWSWVTMAALVCLGLPIATIFVALPFLFGLGESNAGPITLGVVAAVLTLPTAAAEAALFRNGNRPFLEFLAFPVTAVLAIAIPAASGQPSPTQDAYLFALWPKIFAATPFALLAAAASFGATLRTLSLAFIIILAPLYIAKGAIDWSHGRGWRAVVWPARVATDFIGLEDRRRGQKKATMALVAGEPVCIGQHHYRFSNVKVLAHWTNARRPECLSFVQFELSAEALDIAAAVNGKVQVTVSDIGSTRSVSESSPLAIETDDVRVKFFFPQVSRVPAGQHAFVREKLGQFIRLARVPGSS